MIDLDQLIQRTREMAPFRATTVRLAQMIASPDCDISEVAELIAYDEAMTVDLLRAANSAAYANLSQVVTVHEALARLGTAQVLAIAVAAGARPHLQTRLPGYNLNDGALCTTRLRPPLRPRLLRAFARGKSRPKCSPPPSFTMSARS